MNQVLNEEQKSKIEAGMHFFRKGGEKPLGVVDEQVIGRNLLKMSADNAFSELHSKKETVNHPSHYNTDPQFETIKVLRAWLSPEMYEGFLVGNQIKYLSRYRHKNLAEDLKKAQWYGDKLNEEYASGYLK